MSEIVVTVSIQGLPGNVLHTGSITDPDTQGLAELTHTVAATAVRRARSTMIDTGPRHSRAVSQHTADQTVTLPPAR